MSIFAAERPRKFTLLLRLFYAFFTLFLRLFLRLLRLFTPCYAFLRPVTPFYALLRLFTPCYALLRLIRLLTSIQLYVAILLLGMLDGAGLTSGADLSMLPVASKPAASALCPAWKRGTRPIPQGDPSAGVHRAAFDIICCSPSPINSHIQSATNGSHLSAFQ